MFMIIIQDIIRHPATWSVQSTPANNTRKGIRQDIEKNQCQFYRGGQYSSGCYWLIEKLGVN